MTYSSNISRIPENRRDFSEKISELRNLLSELAKTAPAVAGDAFDDLRRQASELWNRSESAQVNSNKSALNTIKLHPLQIMFVALASGFLAWWLITRKEYTVEKNRK